MGKALEIFAARIKELRDEQGLGLREAAAKMGISHSAILMYEKKKWFYIIYTTLHQFQY